MSLNSERLKCPPLPTSLPSLQVVSWRVYASGPYTWALPVQRFTETEYFPSGTQKYSHLSLSYGCLSITSTSVPRNQQRKGVYAAGIIDSLVISRKLHDGGQELHDTCDPQMMWNVWNVSGTLTSI